MNNIPSEDNKKQESKSEKKLETINKVISEEEIDTKLILDSIPIGVCITDQTGKILNVNIALTKLFDYTKEMLIGKPFIDLIAESSRENFSPLSTSWQGNYYVQQGKWKMVDRGGKKFSVLANSSFQIDESTGQPQQLIFLVDVQDHERAQMELQSTINVLHNRLKNQDVKRQTEVHDLKNNVGSIVNIADILLHQKPTKEQARWLQMLMQVGSKTLSMLQTSADYYQMEKRDYLPTIESFDLAEIIRKVTEELKPAIDRRSIILSLYYDGKAVNLHSLAIPMKADVFYIEQLLLQLLKNAVEASPDHETITLEIGKYDDLVLKIHNQGIIPMDIKPQFFDKYVTSGKSNAIGLGTYLAKLIVELHEGTIAHHSSEEAGTTIYIHFPRRLLNE